MVERILGSTPFDPARIQFSIEITETVVMRDHAIATKTLQQLKALGIHLAIDDFGTGYSSLAYLKHFPVDALKVDRTFVWGLSDDPADYAIIRAVTNLAHELGLSVIAEGVETAAQARALRSAGIDMMQGFLYARPQPLEQIVRSPWVSTFSASACL